ncbi:hypothetical protein B0H16DRAFT_241062 [Mycena metata]|uniref:Fungal N-terminal domain-containing protein n=1 Tax=Mycena metata TaxID=1033252 RepID=A0AAD7HVC3_9AGAR|nr:hypothetical protein B0H16DRAFT_241062 [Mycena metata]
MANCTPFPYVSTALGAGVALLELIQMVGKSSDDLIYLAESVVTIMTLLRDEMEAHPTTESRNFRRVCTEFEVHLTQISKDLQLMSRNWSSSKFRKYLNSQNIRDRIDQFTRQVNDLRANATFIVATGARLDVASVADDVATVKVGMVDLQRKLANQRPPFDGGAPERVLHDLARYEEDSSSMP